MNKHFMPSKSGHINKNSCQTACHMTQRYAKIDWLQLRIVVRQKTTHYSAQIIIIHTHDIF